MALNNNGEALFAIAGAGGSGGSAGILLVRLNPAGGALTTLLRQESIVPRFLSALRYSQLTYVYILLVCYINIKILGCFCYKLSLV